MNPVNLGLYSYTYNNPVNLVDPDGRLPVTGLYGPKIGLHIIFHPRESADIALDNIPVVGNIKGGIEAATGENYVTDEKVSNVGRSISAVGILIPWAKNAKHLKKVGDSLDTGAYNKTTLFNMSNMVAD